MGIVSDLNKAYLDIPELTFVYENDQRKGGLSYSKMKELMNGRALNLLRNDLAKVIYNKFDEDIEIIFGDSISKVEQDENEVKISFPSGKIRNFDLLVGADWLHSNGRTLTFKVKGHLKSIMAITLLLIPLRIFTAIKN